MAPNDTRRARRHAGQDGPTEAGPVQIAVPRGRDAGFDPTLGTKRRHRFRWFRCRPVSLSAKGLTPGEISGATIFVVTPAHCRARLLPSGGNQADNRAVAEAQIIFLLCFRLWARHGQQSPHWR
jgi:mutator family transposase